MEKKFIDDYFEIREDLYRQLKAVTAGIPQKESLSFFFLKAFTDAVDLQTKQMFSQNEGKISVNERAVQYLHDEIHIDISIIENMFSDFLNIGRLVANYAVKYTDNYLDFAASLLAIEEMACQYFSVDAEPYLINKNSAISDILCGIVARKNSKVRSQSISDTVIN